MAQKVSVTIVDDMDGSTGDVSTVSFGFRGKSYEIDLNKVNEKRLESALASFIENARPVTGHRGGRAAGAGAPKRTDMQQIREWAIRHGHMASRRGRIPHHIIAEYDATHGR